MLIWLHIGFRKYIEQSRRKLLFSLIYVLFYYTTSNYETNFISNVIPLVLIYIWTKTQFKDNAFFTAIKCIVGIVGMCISQLISVLLLHLLNQIHNNIGVAESYLVLSLNNVLLSVAVYYVLKEKRRKELKIDRFVVFVLLIAVGIVMYIKYEYKNHKGLYGYLYIVLFVLLILFVLVSVKELKTKYELEQKQLELDMKEKYEEAYNLLLLEMRRKQHDYKNQITALYSIQLVDDNKEKLLETRKKYGEELLKSEKYEDLIMGCNDYVLSGYIYTKCKEIERKGIEVEPKIICTKTTYNIRIHKIIEILGILINNAIEYLEEKHWQNKVIGINIFEKSDKLYIEVRNVSDYIPYDSICQMFAAGYTTKGKSHGLGLYSLKTIVEKHKGNVMVENVEEGNVNWLNIRVEV